MRRLSQWEFDIYALSLPRGHGFADCPPVDAWMSDDAVACGIITKQVDFEDFWLIVMRRRVDQVWTVTTQLQGFATQAGAEEALSQQLQNGQSPATISPGQIARPALHELEGREPSDVFKVLTLPSHVPAAWTLNQLYLALPRPDRNWAADCQTSNFHTRLWEAQLLASFREQGLLVTQPYESPDFKIENRLGGEAWVEAVTANPPQTYNHANAQRTAAPVERNELFFGRAALRFAKTIGNKLARQYDQLPHVLGRPFALAVADFQEPGSMLWSREGLIGYLYGQGAYESEVDGRKLATPMFATKLLGPTEFPAGLFTDGRAASLSAVIFTNACSIAKLNRVAVSGQGAPKGFRYTRLGNFFDRTPGAMKGIPFCMDIESEEYRGLWPQGYEPWCAELEVFHNPFAASPIPFELLPEVTHWFDQGGELVCRSIYETSILWSQTSIQDADEPPLTLDAIVAGAGL